MATPLSRLSEGGSGLALYPAVASDQIGRDFPIGIGVGMLGVQPGGLVQVRHSLDVTNHLPRCCTKPTDVGIESGPMIARIPLVLDP